MKDDRLQAFIYFLACFIENNGRTEHRSDPQNQVEQGGRATYSSLSQAQSQLEEDVNEDSE